MNTREAKEILLLYRGTMDDADPQFRAALDYAKTDPELGQWLREQTSVTIPFERSFAQSNRRLVCLRKLCAGGRSRFRAIGRALVSLLPRSSSRPVSRRC